MGHDVFQWNRPAAGDYFRSAIRMYKVAYSAGSNSKEETFLSPNTKPRILVLTGTLGDGHNQAARAIAEAVLAMYPNADVKVVDYLSWTHPRLHTLGRFCYMQGIKGLPSVYGYLYRATRDENRLSTLFKQMRTFRSSRMMELLEEQRPSIVVSTFPAAAAAMSYLKISGLTSVPTVTVITDYARHSYWIHPATDKYMVGSQHICQSLVDFGIPQLRHRNGNAAADPVRQGI